jgi:hypothetical protein
MFAVVQPFVESVIDSRHVIFGLFAVQFAVQFNDALIASPGLTLYGAGSGTWVAGSNSYQA